MRFFEEIHDEREERHREQIAKLQERLDLAISQRDELRSEREVARRELWMEPEESFLEGVENAHFRIIGIRSENDALEAERDEYKRRLDAISIIAQKGVQS